MKAAALDMKEVVDEIDNFCNVYEYHPRCSSCHVLILRLKYLFKCVSTKFNYLIKIS